MVARRITVALGLLLGSLGAQASSIGVYFDSAGTRDASELPPFGMATCFVVVRGLSGGLTGYEFSIESSPGLTLMSATMLPASSLNVGSSPANWIVGVGSCLPEQSSRAVLQLTVFLAADAVNLLLSLGPSQPSSVYGEGPAYATCDDQIYGFDQVEAAIINLRPESFGRVKHRFGEH